MKRARKAAGAPEPASHPGAVAAHRGIVGIGASSGGLKALQGLFTAMPADTGLAFVIVQHLSPEHESHMAEILGRHTAMKVIEAADGVALAPDVVYTVPPGVFVSLREGRFRMSGPAADHEVRMPIDFFLDSLAQDQGAGTVCVILSGSGTDGTHGLRAIRGAGGMAVVQDPGTAEFDSMPKSAIATGLADHVLPVKAMPPALRAFAGRVRAGVGDEIASAEDAAVVDKILELLNTRTGQDYCRYKKGTVGRRMLRRMDLHQIGSLPDYLKFLTEHPDEVVRLSKDMLIGVTSFFRDAEAFAALRESVIRPLVAAAVPGGTIRAWVPGCATGEEAYSIAMLLKEELSAREIAAVTIQVFASDVDESALSVGRAGVYASSVAGDVSPERLARFFVKRDGGWQVAKDLRDTVIFSLHNLLADPPFAKLDLVSCRNLLIYIEPELQNKVLALFAFTLNLGGGYLFLGRSETIGKAVDWFDMVDEKWRMFRRNSARVPTIEFPLGSGRLRGLVPGRTIPARSGPINYGDVVRRVALETRAVGVALVNARGKVLYLDGPIDRFLDLPAGEPSLNIFTMVKDGLAARLRAAVRKATEAREVTDLHKVRLKRPGGDVVADVTVRPAPERVPEGLVAVLFETPRAPEAAARAGRGTPEAGPAPVVEQLEAELWTLREEIRTVNKDHEASTEEFESANEEVMAMNEELQSANEELESSREELQSLNEELGTVNTQLSERLRDLDAVNNDLSNLMAATAIATVFLDRGFRIKSFTPAATGLLRLLPADIGRSIGDIAQRFDGADLASVAELVLKDLSPVEREVRAKDGGWHLLRVLPYRTLDDKIDGVVITLTDVTHLKLSEAEAQSARDYAESIVETIHEPLIVLDAGLRVVSANRAFYRAFQMSKANVEGRPFFELSYRQWDIPGLRALMEQVLPAQAVIEGYVVEHESPSLGPRTVIVNARTIPRDRGRAPLILLAIEDVTERRRTEEVLRESEMRLRLAQEAAKAGTWVWNLLTGKHFLSEELWRLCGLEPHSGELSHEAWLQTVHPNDRERANHAVQEAACAEGELFAEWRAPDHDGAERWLMSRGQPVRDVSGRVVRYIGIVMDISERKWMEVELKKSRDELEQKVVERTAELQIKSDQLLHSQKLEALGRLAGGVAHDFNNLMAVVTGYGRRVLRDKGLASVHRSAVEQMTKAGEGAMNLTRQLLAFGRKQVISPVVLDLNAIVDGMRPMLSTVMGDGVAVVFELQPDLRPVLADPTQITHAIMNLAVNARDAMPTGGRLTIRTAGVQVPAAVAVVHADIPPGRYALLSVSDNGTGMSEEAREHVFEPFFTTKDYGEGTGLGLSSVYGIVQQSGGHIRMETALGQGTSFSLYFPISEEEGGCRAAPQPPGGPEAEAPRGSETILLVENDPSVCQLVTVELRDLGYRVLPCETAGDAIREAGAHEGPVDLLLSDVTLPGISGPTLAQMLKERGKVEAKRVLFMSGHAEKHIVQRGILVEGVAFIGKPFATEALARKIRKLLDAGDGPRQHTGPSD